MIVIGFGSLVLDLFNMEFTILSWAEDYQPWAGIGIGVLGVLIIVIQALVARGKNVENASKDAA